MLGIILIIFMARQFYNLAFDYNKSKWGWAILSIVIFYGIQFIVALILVFALGLDDSQKYSRDYFIVLISSLMASIVGAFVLYRYLKQRWEKELETAPAGNTDLLDDNVQTTHDL